MATEAGTVEVVMPAMGDSVAEGTVLEWRKQEGDPVTADETIVEISTDKVDAEIPAPVGGRLAKILAAEGETIAVGAPLAEIATGDGNGTRPEAGEPEGTHSGQAGNGGAPRETAPAVEREPSAESEPPAREAKVIDIVTPTGGESVTEGTILEWIAKVGESVKQGDTVVVISTDKVDMELPAPGSGTVSEVLAEEGATVTVGQVIGRMTTETSGERAQAPHGDGHAAADAPAPPAAPEAPASRSRQRFPDRAAHRRPAGNRLVKGGGLGPGRTDNQGRRACGRGRRPRGRDRFAVCGGPRRAAAPWRSGRARAVHG